MTFIKPAFIELRGRP